MGCPPVRGDNPRALARGLSYVQVGKHVITILYHLHQCRPCTSRDISAKVGKGGMMLITFANSLDPDQARQSAGPDLDPNCLIL